MGWFEDKDKGKLDAKEAEPPGLITDYNQLIASYNDTVNRIQLLLNQAYQAIYPMYIDLIGNPDSPQDGRVNKIRRMLRDSPMQRTTLGQEMSRAAELIEDLNGWQSRYIEQLEQFIDAITKQIAPSAFAIVEHTQKEMADMKNNMLRMQDAMGKTEAPRFEHTIPTYPQYPQTSIINHKTPNPEPQYDIYILTEERKKELEAMYHKCQNDLEFARLIGPKGGGKNMHPAEVKYIREYHQKLKLERKTNPSNTATPPLPQPPVYSPFSEKPLDAKGHNETDEPREG